MTHTFTPSATAPPGGLRQRAGAVFAYLSGLFSLGVVVQVFLAGAGVFGIDDTDVSRASSLDPHRAMGNALGIAAVVLLVVALVGRLPARTTFQAFVLALLTEVAQHGLAEAGVHHRWLGALHAADGALILLLACWITVTTWPRRPEVTR